MSLLVSGSRDVGAVQFSDWVSMTVRVLCCGLEPGWPGALSCFLALFCCHTVLLDYRQLLTFTTDSTVLKINTVLLCEVIREC